MLVSRVIRGYRTHFSVENILDKIGSEAVWHTKLVQAVQLLLTHIVREGVYGMVITQLCCEH